MWNAQEGILSKVRKQGLSYFDISHQHFNLSKPYVIGCIEERHRAPKIAAPGAGIFWSEADMKMVALRIRRKGIKLAGIAPHHDCGAEGIVKDTLMKEGMNADEANNEIRKRRHMIHEIMGAPLFPPAEIKCVQYHIARCLFLVCTDVFDVSLITGLYPFQVNARYSPSERDTIKQVSLALKIATGPQGYGKKFTAKNPFVIVVVGHPTNSAYGCEAMTRKLQPLVDGYNGVVEVIGNNVDAELLKS
jgi:hypothetical protein